MAFTRQQYDALCAAIAAGAEFVKYSDKEVHYMPLEKMMLLKRMMEGELGIGTRRGRVTVGVYTKGLTDAPCRERPSSGGTGTGAVVPPQRIPRDVTVLIKTTPDPLALIAVGEKYIRAQYAPGPTLTLMEVAVDGTEIGPYLIGKSVKIPVFKNNKIYQDMIPNSTDGSIDNSANGGFVDATADGGVPDKVTVQFIDVVV